MENLSMTRWVGKTGIVTGASSGIGYAVALQLAQAGVNVAALARRVDRLEKLEAAAKGAKGKILPVQCDVRKEDDIKAAFRKAESTFGPVHILINNAGVLHISSGMDMDVELWKSMIETNVLGLSICAREAVQSMKKNNVAGHIVNVNSIAGHKLTYMAGTSCYFATKHSVTVLSEMLRMDINTSGLKIKLTSLSPGLVESEMSAKVIEEAIKKGAEINLADLPKPCIISSDECALTIMMALATPPNVNISELTVQPVGELY